MGYISSESRVGTVIRGNIKVIQLLRKFGKSSWMILGECQHCNEHTVFEVRLADVVGGHTTSCGCKPTGAKPGARREKAVDSIGKFYGKIEVKSIERTARAKVYVKAICHNCNGTEFVAGLNDIKNGTTKSCGCIKGGYPGELMPSGCTLIRPMGKNGNSHMTTWEVMCHCDSHTIFEARIDSLRDGSVSSCGCNTGLNVCGYIQDGKLIKFHSMSEVFDFSRLEDEGYHVERPRIPIWTPYGTYTPDIYINELDEFHEIKGFHLFRLYPESSILQEKKRQWLRLHRGLKIKVIDSEIMDKEFGIKAKWG